MEPTANSSPATDPRTTSSRLTPAEAPPQTQSACTDSLSSWDGPGTAYALPFRPAPHASSSPQPETGETPPTFADLPLPEPLQLAPAPRPIINRGLIAGVAGLLIAAVAIVLWEPWAIDETADAPLNPESAAPVAQLPMVEAGMGTEALVIPPSEPVPEDLPADMTAASQPEQPHTQAQVPEAPQPVEQPQSAETIAAVQPESTPAAIQAPDEVPATSPMTVTAKKYERPAKLQARRSAPARAATGTVTIAVKPWGEVWIDGKKRGISPPLLKLQLRPGTYLIELRNPGLPSHSQKMDVAEGQSVTLQYNFQ